MGASFRESPHSFREALRVVGEILSANHEVIRSGALVAETELIVVEAYRRVSGKVLSRLELVTRLEDRFPEQAGEHVLVMAGLRAEGHPLQYATGRQTFLDHDYAVGPGVLVPRPETEVLVREVMERVLFGGPASRPLLGVEVGLGSGAISLELLARFPALRMIATELSPRAQQYAEANAAAILGPSWRERLEIRGVTDPVQVLEPLSDVTGADFIVSNPPYLLATDEIAEDVARHEPREALYSPDADPVHFYRRIADCAAALLAPIGFVAVEIPHNRDREIRALFSRFRTETVQDLTGRERVLVATI